MNHVYFVALTQDEYDHLIPNQYTFYKCTDTNSAYIGTKQITNEDLDLSNLEQQIINVQQIAEEAQSQASSALTNITDLTESLDNLDTYTKESITTLTNNLTTISNKLDELDSSIAEDITNLGNELNDLKSSTTNSIDALTEKLESTETEIASINEDIEAINNKINTIESTITTLAESVIYDITAEAPLTASVDESGIATIAHDESGAAADTYGPSADETIENTIIVPSITIDKYGHITKIENITLTLPEDENTDFYVKQEVNEENADFPILSTQDANQEEEVVGTTKFSSKITMNPSTGTITADKFAGTAAAADTASALGEEDIGSDSQFIYLEHGTAAASQVSIGDNNHPIYLKDGIFTSCEDDGSKSYVIMLEEIPEED